MYGIFVAKKLIDAPKNPWKKNPCKYPDISIENESILSTALYNAFDAIAL